MYFEPSWIGMSGSGLVRLMTVDKLSIGRNAPGPIANFIVNGSNYPRP